MTPRRTVKPVRLWMLYRDDEPYIGSVSLGDARANKDSMSLDGYSKHRWTTKRGTWTPDKPRTRKGNP